MVVVVVVVVVVSGGANLYCAHVYVYTTMFTSCVVWCVMCQSCLFSLLHEIRCFIVVSCVKVDLESTRQSDNDDNDALS